MPIELQPYISLIVIGAFATVALFASELAHADSAPAPLSRAAVTAGSSTEYLQTVYFDFDSCSLTQTARLTIENNAKLLAQMPDATVILIGHNDERGSSEYSIATADRRSRAVLTYLVSLGIDRTRITTISHGKDNPADPGHNEKAWAKNRRVEFIFFTASSQTRNLPLRHRSP